MEFLFLAIFSIFTLQVGSTMLSFYEEPIDSYITKNQPVVLKCKIENARTGFFKCNDQWTQDTSSSRIIQIGNKQLLTLELTITKSQLDEFRKLALVSNTESIPSFWCVCQGWLNGADDTIISQKAYVKQAYLNQIFDWEPMPTTGLIGKSVEIRCLPPEGEPKPALYWLKNGQPIEKSNKRIYISHEGSLLINEVRSSDSANYTCVAENLAGKRTSDPAYLTVTENKGWSEWSNWTECKPLDYSNCGEGVQKRFRTCQNPPTINNALGCDGFPYQTITCFIPCNNEQSLEEIPKKNDKSVLSHYSIQNTKNRDNDIGYHWTQWSAWSMICNADCMRSRKRDCKYGYLSPNGKLIQVNDENKENKLKKDNCFGPDIEYSNCTFFCEKISNLIPPSNVPKEFPYMTVVCLVLSIATLLFISFIISFFTMRKKKDKMDDFKSSVELGPEHHPIYFSIQPEYNQDHYMESLLPFNNNSNPNMYGYDYTTKSYKNSQNSSTTSGSNSTTSSKIKLSTSPTDSLAKSSHYLMCETSICEKTQDFENNSFQILKLINEKKTAIYSARNIKFDDEFYNEFDMYSFNILNSGGLIEIPKYSIHALIPDETFSNEICAGILKCQNENVLGLQDDETLLSSIFLVKTNYQDTVYPRPILFSMDHSAMFTDTDWECHVYYKNFNDRSFKKIDQKQDTNFYSQIVSNRCFIMTHKDGMYALVGRPKLNGNQCPSYKQMKYAILLIDGEIRVYLIQNTKGANEALNEQIQKSNGKIIKMPEVFELNYPKRSKIENSYLNLELNVTYNNLVINSDSTCRKIRFSDIWNSSYDFIEIQIPFSLNDQACKQLKQSINFRLLNDVNKINLNRTNFDLKVSLELEDKLLFSYSNLNTNICELHTANCNQQEFYSSVSVNPVFIPLKVTLLLDEFMQRSFKMNTLKKDDWRLFADLLKCDKNVQYFALRENSFELIMSLWLVINLNRNENEESLTVNFMKNRN